MHHETTLIATIAVGFVLAFGLGFVADRLRLPPLVGYLIAGIVVGPHTPGFNADVALAGQLAELGVILLMFGVGLHFSAADIFAVRALAVPGAVGQIVLATLVGMGLAALCGWSIGTGLVFGLSLSVASTVVLLKALEERNLVNTPNGRVAVGWLIVEDLAMVLALVLLPAFAEILGGRPPGATGGGAAAAGDRHVLVTLAITLAKVGAFAALAILLGPKVVPWMLKQVARTGSRELFTLSVLAVAIGIAYGSAEVFGVSFALGAFFAGVVLSESHFSHKAAANSLPLQDAFSVIFFLSVGMLFNPAILLREPLAVLAVLALIMVGKAVIAFGIVMALRFPVGTGLMVAASLAQIGEFSFILIGLGATLGLMNDTARDLVLAGAILSIALNPLAIWFSMKMQERFAGSHYGLKRFAKLEGDLERIRARGEEREKQRELKIQSLWDTFPFLSLLDKDDQEKLLLQFRPRSASPGDRIIRKGQSGDSMFFIATGAVEVSVAGQSHRLEAGAFFGEIALLTGSRRTADVTAIDFCQLMVLTRRDFNQFMWRYPELRKAVAEMAAQRREMNLNFSRQPSMTQPPNLPDTNDATSASASTEPPSNGPAKG